MSRQKLLKNLKECAFNVTSISSNVDWWLFQTNLRDFLWILLIFLFSPLDGNIQIRGQYESWDFIKEFSKGFLWDGDVNFVILTSALSFWLVFFADIFQMTFESWLIINSNAQYFFFWYIFDCNAIMRKIALTILKSKSYEIAFTWIKNHKIFIEPFKHFREVLLQLFNDSVCIIIRSVKCIIISVVT